MTQNCQSLDWETVKNTIRDQPEVDPAKHAHWVRVARSENEYWQCSNCHGYFTLPMPKYRGFYMRYCGCCGAKMDEVTNGCHYQNHIMEKKSKHEIFIKRSLI